MESVKCEEWRVKSGEKSQETRIKTKKNVYSLWFVVKSYENRNQ